MIERISPRKLNKDSDDRSLSPDEMKEALNISVGIDKDGDAGIVKMADGNVKSPLSDEEAQALLSGETTGNATVIGSVSDEELGVIYYFVYADDGNHSIWAYSSNTKQHRCIIRSSTLDFDRDGFVKGDIVRVKRLTVGGIKGVYIGQGEEGGAVNFGDGIDVPDPIAENPPTPFTIDIERDLYRLIELDEEISSLQAAINRYSSAQFKISITGTSGFGSESISFYNAGDDLNLNPPGLSEVLVDMSIEATPDGKSVYASGQTTIYLDPAVASDPTADLNILISPTAQNFQVLGESVGFGPQSNINASESITIGTTGGGYTSVSNSSTFGSSAPVLGLPQKVRGELTINDVFAANQNGSWQTIRDENAKLANKWVTPGTQTFDNLDTAATGGGFELPLDWRTVPVRIAVNYENSQAYQRMLDLIEIQEETTSQPSDWGPAAIARSKQLIPTDQITQVFVSKWCPASMRFRLFFTPIQYQTIDGDGNYVDYNAFQNFVLEDVLNYGAASFQGVTPGGGFEAGDIASPNNLYTNYGAMFAAAQAYLSGEPQSFLDGGVTAYNWVIINVGSLPGIEDCPTVNPEDVFKPTMVYAPYEQGAAGYQNVPTIYEPYDWVQPDNVLDLVGKTTYNYLINVPIGSPVSTADDGFILTSYNNSVFDAYKFVEQVYTENGYDLTVGVTYLNGTVQSLFPDALNTALNFSDDQISLPYPVSLNQASAVDLTTIRGRRAFIKTRNVASPNISLMRTMQLNGSSGNPSIISMCPDSTAELFLDFSAFCFERGINCPQAAGLPPTKNVIPPAPEIDEGDFTIISVEGDQATVKDDEAVPESTRPEPITTTKTKETVKKKY